MTQSLENLTQRVRIMITQINQAINALVMDVINNQSMDIVTSFEAFG